MLQDRRSALAEEHVAPKSLRVQFAESATTIAAEPAHSETTESVLKTVESSAPAPEPSEKSDEGVKAPKNGKTELAIIMPAQGEAGPPPSTLMPMTVASTNANNDPDMSKQKREDLSKRLEAAKQKAKPERKNAAKGKAKAKAKMATKSKAKKPVEEEDDENPLEPESNVSEEESNGKSADEQAGFVPLPSNP